VRAETKGKQKMKKTRKVLDIHEGGKNIYCIKDSTEALNPYRIYEAYYTTDGKKHTRLLMFYEDFNSVICYISELFKIINK
jgi:hypothetical protein